jgi:hypothetical protein
VQNDDISAAVPCDWSPDGKWIASGLRRKDGTGQLALIDALDGTVRVLKSVTEWSSTSNNRSLFFSPDGKYLAYGDGQQSFVIAVDASREAVLFQHDSQNTVMGWSPDGQFVLFSSDRSGAVGLWAIGVKDGRPSGEPVLVKPDLLVAGPDGGRDYVRLEVREPDLRAGLVDRSRQRQALERSHKLSKVHHLERATSLGPRREAVGVPVLQSLGRRALQPVDPIHGDRTTA